MKKSALADADEATGGCLEELRDAREFHVTGIWNWIRDMPDAKRIEPRKKMYKSTALAF